MGLQKAFNLVLGAIFLVGLLITGYISYITELQQARQTGLQNARLIFEAAATKAYTTQVAIPQFQTHLAASFPQPIVSAYTAIQTFALLSEKLPNHTGREPVFRPFDPQNLPSSWEVEIIRDLMSNPGKNEIIGQRETSLFFGEEPRQASMEAVTELELLEIRPPAIKALLSDDPNHLNLLHKNLADHEIQTP